MSLKVSSVIKFETCIETRYYFLKLSSPRERERERDKEKSK